jgi:hypothetical protein
VGLAKTGFLRPEEMIIEENTPLPVNFAIWNIPL